MAGEIDGRLVAALLKQLEQRRAAFGRGARHVGWKLGMGDRERIGGHVAVGYLTSETVLEPRARYQAAKGAVLCADAEAMVELAGDVDPAAGPAAVAAAIGRYGGAVELVDLAPVPGEPDAVVAANVFHRAVAFVDLGSAASENVAVMVTVDGQVRASEHWPGDLPKRLHDAAVVLDAVGERLRSGDRIITGSIVQVPIGRGERVTAGFGDRASVQLEIEPP